MGWREQLGRRKGSLMHDIVKWNGKSSALVRLEEALARDRRSPALTALRALAPAMVRKEPLPARVDLLRVCAQHGGHPWAAIYLLGPNSGYHYSTSIAITKTLYRTQYAPGLAVPVVWDSSWIDEETCALCGVSGFGPVRCNRCEKLVCRGRSTGQYFRCYCGNENWATHANFEHPGMIPKLGR
jgi:hypothetical protein